MPLVVVSVQEGAAQSEVVHTFEKQSPGTVQPIPDLAKIQVARDGVDDGVAGATAVDARLGAVFHAVAA